MHGQNRHVARDGHPMRTHARVQTYEKPLQSSLRQLWLNLVPGFGGISAAETSPRVGEAASPRFLTFTVDLAAERQKAG